MQGVTFHSFPPNKDKQLYNNVNLDVDNYVYILVFIALGLEDKQIYKYWIQTKKLYRSVLSNFFQTCK